MALQQILFIIFGTLVLAGAVVCVVLRQAFYAALALAASCLGVVGLLVTLGAPVLAGVQALVCVGGIGALIKFAPPQLRQMVRRERLGHSRWWYVIVLVVLIPLGLVGWTAFTHAWGAPLEADFVPRSSIAAFGRALVDPAGFVLPVALLVLLVLAALGGAVLLVRER